MPATDRGRAFANLIREARKNFPERLSQDALADRAGVARTTIMRWESGTAERPDAEQVRRVCAILGIDPRRAAIALGYLSEEEVYGTRPELPAEVEEILAILQDPSVSAADKANGLEYLRYLREKSRRQSS